MKVNRAFFGTIKDNLEKYTFFLIIVGNIVLGGAGNGGGHTRELVFPFFSWNLYSSMPIERYEYIVSLPLLENENLLRYVPLSQREYVRSVVQRYGEAYQNNNEEEKTWLASIIKKHTPAHTDTFALSLVQSNSLSEYLQSKKYVTHIVTFTIYE